FLINNDGAFMDFEDPINNKWIRIELTTGDFISAPAGIVFRAGISPESLKTVSSLVALKMPAGNLEALFAAKHFVVGKDAEKYRSEYIKALQE
ncbi:1,2-dihydroxy-3-keto-5-methylthiopentene dioxygenase, partial [Marasmius crinis-equi]